MTKDFHARLKDIKDPRAYEAYTKMDAAYRAWKEGPVSNLARVTKDNISPESAFNALTGALQGKNYGVLREYVAANGMHRAETANNGIGVLVAHMMEGTNSRTAMEGFQKAWGKITPEAKVIMKQGEGQPLVEALDRLHKLSGPAMQKEASKSFGLGWKGHGVIGLATILNHYVAAGAAVGGQYVLGRLISRPGYVNWLTRAAQIQNTSSRSHEWSAHLAKLRVMTGEDRETGKDIWEALSSALPAPAAPQQKPTRRGFSEMPSRGLGMASSPYAQGMASTPN
jgi:hypothetical protein